MRIAMFGQKRIPSREGGVEVVVEELSTRSREGGVEVVVEELSTRMVKLGHEVTAFNRRGHHVAGDEYDSSLLDEYKGVKTKTVPTINGKGARDIIGSTKKYHDN